MLVMQFCNISIAMMSKVMSLNQEMNVVRGGNRSRG